MENSTRFLKKIIELPYYPAILLVSIYSQDLGSRVLKRHLYIRVHSSITGNTSIMAANLSVNGGISKCGI